MIALLVTGHGNFATGICSALNLIAGENEHILAVDFEAKHNTHELEENKDIEIMAGTNLPMLIEAFMLMNVYDDAADMAKALVETGKSQVLRLELKEHKDDVAEDGI